MLRTHLEYLLKTDPGFIRFWERLTTPEREEFIRRSLDIVEAGGQPEAHSQFDRANALIRGLFIVIPELNLIQSRIARDWNLFAMNEQEKQLIYRAAESTFQEYLSKYELSSSVSLYGGLKTIPSILNKSEERNPSKLADLWDVVRFRMVVPNLRNVLVVSLQLCGEYDSSLLKCRNYYTHPKITDSRHSYRAVHFQIPIHDRMVELQVMTLIQETVSYLDHAIAFKRQVPPLSQSHLDWLEKARLGALILDHASIPESIVSPADLICPW
jgi:ppGpp synthetase/RelA/SpoT-type nucleotidyltranferase